MLGFSATAESGVKVSSRILERYVLRGEQVEVATRQHWAIMSEPAATVVIGFFAVAWTSSGLERAFGEFGLYLWWVWFGLIFRLMWKMLEWRNEWFVATDKRLLLTYGLFTHKVAMMPLGKVTDLNYGRSIAGRFLGYGTFTLESAGQDQALREINWLPDPDQTYRRICDIIFGPQSYDSEDSLRPGRRGRPPAAEPARARFPSPRIAADSEMQQEGRGRRRPDEYDQHDSQDQHDQHEKQSRGEGDEDDRWVTDSQRAARAQAQARAEEEARAEAGSRPETEDGAEGPDGAREPSGAAQGRGSTQDAGWQTSPESAPPFQSVSGQHGPDEEEQQDDDITGPIPRPPR